MKVITFNEMIVHPIPIFDSLQILRLNDVFQLQLVTFVYECVNNLPLCISVTTLLAFLLPTVLVPVNLKGVICLLKEKTQLNMEYDQFTFLVIWNSLTLEVTSHLCVKRELSLIITYSLCSENIMRYHFYLKHVREGEQRYSC